MRPFVDRDYGIKMKKFYKLSNGFVFYSEKDEYTEFEAPLDTLYFVWYFIPRDDNSFFVTTCWPEFEMVYESANKGKIEIDDFYDTFPTFKELIYNTCRQDYSKCHLIRTYDLDDPTKITWMVLKLFQGCSIRDYEKSCMEQPDDIGMLLSSSTQLKKELSTNKLNFKWKHLKETISGAAMIAIDNLVIPQIAEIATSFIGNKDIKNLVATGLGQFTILGKEHLLTMDTLPKFKFKDVVTTKKIQEYSK